MTSTDFIDAVRDARAARFAELERRPDGTAPWLRSARRAAFDRFAALDFPSVRLEAWRSTDVSPIARTAFRSAPASAGRPVPRPEGTRGAGPAFVFLDGRWSPELSSSAGLPRGVEVRSLRQALASQPAVLEAYLARQAPFADHPFTALNTAFFEDGAFVHLQPGAVVELPIQLLFTSAASGGATEPFETHPRILVVAEAGSQATFVESYEGAGRYFTNAVTEIVLGPGAVIAHCKLQRESTTAFHVARVHARLGRGSSFTSHSVALGAALARNEVDVVFDAEGGQCALYGLYAAGDSQHSDNQTFVDHAQPHCCSNQLYKGVLTGTARGVFNGRVVVRKDAQKTDAHQTNRNLLLSETALVDTKPQLEIHADDVRCTHGATIGRLAEEALFYLQSRGIGPEESRDILTRAFALETVAGAQPEMLRADLEARIGAALTRLGSAGRVA